MGLVSVAHKSSLYFVIMAAEPESISPLDKTPTTSNSRSTPPSERGIVAAFSVALQIILFQRPIMETVLDWRQALIRQ